jgi:hypothetical protein
MRESVTPALKPRAQLLPDDFFGRKLAPHFDARGCPYWKVSFPRRFCSARTTANSRSSSLSSSCLIAVTISLGSTCFEVDAAIGVWAMADEDEGDFAADGEGVD